MNAGKHLKPLGSAATRVLVIDDEENLRDMLTRAFRRRGFEVSVAESGEKGVAAARAAEFDVVICDVVMTGMDGFAVLEELKREQPLLEVIMVTGSPRAEAAERAARSGAFDYLAKPFLLAELCVLVDAAAAKRRGSSAPS